MKFIAPLLLVVLAAAGVFAAVALANHGVGSLACGQPARITFDSFPTNGHPNTVSYVVKHNGSVVDQQTVTFTGSSATYTSVLVSSGTWQISTAWNTNGVSGSSDTGVQTLSCGTTTTIPVTTTTTVPVTTTVPSVQTVTVVQTVTNTIQSPPPPPVTVTETVTNTVTLPAPPAKMITRVVVKWRKCPPVPKPPKPKTLKMLCLAGRANHDFWANGRCYFRGNG